MNFVDRYHARHIYDRRVRVLSDHVSRLLPENASVLDVGCGDGLLASRIIERRRDVRIEGIDVLARPMSHVPVRLFDGRSIPHSDRSFDVVTILDVLHHTDDPRLLLRESARVARRIVIVKDHLREGLLADATLRLMDAVGNARHGVPLPYNFWTELEWRCAFAEVGLRPITFERRLGIYALPLSWMFDRGLHCLVQLVPEVNHR
jgi:SAM-dependent methyltransferase